MFSKLPRIAATVALLLGPAVQLVWANQQGDSADTQQPGSNQSAAQEPAARQDADLADDPNSATAAASDWEPAEDSSGFLQSALSRTRCGERLARRAIDVMGWTEASFTGSTASPNQLPLGFNYLANRFLIQQNWLRIDQAIDTAAEQPTHGFRLDTILPGTDYRFTVIRGLFDSQLTADNGSPNLYGIDPVQFYYIGYRPDLGEGTEIKLGRFFAPYGVENIDATQTPLASRSYTFIYDPFTNTGLLATTKLSETWSLWNGLATGNDVFIDAASSPSYIGGVKWTAPGGRGSVQFVTLLGNGEFDTEESFHNPQIFDLVLTYQLTEQCSWAAEGLYGFTNGVPGIGFADWYGIVNYVTWRENPDIARTLRLEFFDDTVGQRTGVPGLYSALTAGINRQLCRWLTVRPELRCDHNSNRPFSGEADLFTAALSAIVAW